jgi:AraC-like DNA-binding protein
MNAKGLQDGPSEAGNKLPQPISFLRSRDLPGVEIMVARQLAHDVRWFHTSFGIGLSSTWRGETRYQRRSYVVTPGMALCTEPGEVSTTPRIFTAGSLYCFMFSPEALRDYLREYHDDAGAPRWLVPVATLSTSLVARMDALLRAFGSAASVMCLQSACVDLVEALAAEQLKVPTTRTARCANSLRVAQRLRECVHDGGPSLDLTGLAEATNLSRFQALREFKRRFGLPPHAYQLSVRIARGRRLLAQGSSPAEAAAECGFVDQSHFTRHFKRMVGVTPATYMRACEGRGGTISLTDN